MKKSAGILVYKFENNKIKVFLSHMGGPYYQGKDNNAWSIPKGELEENEKTIDGAIREFYEETNIKIENNDIKFLASKKVSNNKLIIIFYKNQNIDIENCKSNYFELEWPKGSGNIQKFPEMDKSEWINIEDTNQKITHNQIFFINKLQEKLNNQ